MISQLSIQWHITARCNNRCRHCYVYDRTTYQSETEEELDLRSLILILDSITAFQRKWQARIERFFISGGDPLTHPGWASLLQELKERNKRIIMGGNPETLTAKNLKILSNIGISRFQMSLDGMEKTHDNFRSSGSFRRTVRAIDRLKDHGIPVGIMFTLYPCNKDDLIPLLNYVAARTRADGFSFDIGTFTGNAALLAERWNVNELKELLSSFLAEKKRLESSGFSLRIVEKNSFLRLIRFEESSFFPFFPEDVAVVSGCSAGWTGVVILSDGKVLPCRRAPIVAGRMPEQSFEQVFLESEVLKKFRRPQYFTECRGCRFYHYCRGCPSLVHSLTGDPFAPHPLCFRKTLQKKLPVVPALEPVTMQTTKEEEHELVCRHYENVFSDKYEEFVEDTSLQRVLASLLEDDNEKRLYLEAPDTYLSRRGLTLDTFKKIILQQYASDAYSSDSRSSRKQISHRTRKPQGFFTGPFAWSPWFNTPL